MKALVYIQAHKIENFSIREMEVPKPELKPYDVLVEVKAFSINPVDVKVRASRNAGDNQPVILGWDMAGVVREIGSEVRNFKIGDEVYGAGDISRAGSYSEFCAIDSRIIAKKPRALSFTQAAALPLTALTAWEALIARPEMNLNNPKATVLIIGGAGGVGSIATQLLKAKTKARVFVTASRPETIEWCLKMGADGIVDHRKDIASELQRQGVEQVDAVFSTTHSDSYMEAFGKIIRPFGHLALIDDPKVFDIVSLKRKAISVHWELMFTKTLFGFDLESQGEILKEVAGFVDEGRIKTTVNVILKGATEDHVKYAHELLEKGTSIGKLVIER